MANWQSGKQRGASFDPAISYFVRLFATPVATWQNDCPLMNVCENDKRNAIH
jgi:hypothetical protein